MKKIIFYILCFITSILLICDLFFIVGRSTVLSKSYIVDSLDRNNYKEEIYKSINTSIKEYIPSSGFSDNILKDIFTQDKVNSDIDILINGLYSNEEIKIDTTSIKDKLVSNMKEELSNSNYSVSDEVISSYADKLVDIYRDKITISDKISNYTHIINNINKIINMLIIIFSVLVVTLLCVILKVFGHSPFPIVFYTGGFSLLCFIIYFNINTNINNISILGKAASGAVVTVVNSIFNNLTILGIICLVCGFISYLIREVYKANKLRKRHGHNKR